MQLISDLKSGCYDAGTRIQLHAEAVARNQRTSVLTEVAPSIDRISPTRRPDEKAIGYQKWSNLLFVHWRLPAQQIQPLLPPELSLDTWDGDAWVGLVPFYMSGVRPWWSPPVPGISNFCETNVRTYVHLGGKAPGVWFFSLEAAQSLAVRIARRFWNLPYFRAEMSYSHQGNKVSYRSRRLWPEPSGATTNITAEIGELIRDDSEQPGSAAPETLEFFLAERYYLYSVDSSGKLYRGQVHHRPYPLRAVQVNKLEETLLSAADIKPTAEPCHALYSDGVDVEIFRLRTVSSE